ncbi:MAG: hypothetical protein AD742_15730 [Methylibium sp. NZG]|nr:MAG: hypothetical protein AD742_15730 [Methylibium sp. NZG]
MVQRGLTALALPILFTACGGGSEQEGDTAYTAQTIQTTDSAATAVVSPLFADDGSVMPSPPSLTPADPQAHTRAGRYATEAQAEQLESALGNRSISTVVNLGDNEPTVVEEAVSLALMHQSAHGLSLEAPVLVRVRDLRLAAATADSLADLGFRTVFVVTR